MQRARGSPLARIVAVTAAVLAVGSLIVVLLVTDDDGDDCFVLTNPDAPFVPVIVSTEVAVGEPRLVLRLVDWTAEPRFAAATYTVRFFEPVESGVRFRADHSASVVDVADAATTGGRYYVVDAPLDAPGEWALAVTVAPADSEALTSARLPFLVADAPRTPAVGAAAPPVETATSGQFPIEALSTGNPGVASLYERSLRELLAGETAFAVLFASPGRCASPGLCERALRQAAALHDGGLPTIHVDPFAGLGDPDGPYPEGAAVLETWSLRGDPWLFIVGPAGRVLDKFEVVAPDEALTTAAANARNALGGG